MKNSVFLPILFSYCLLPSFPPSSYFCTPIGRQPKVFPQNPFARSDFHILVKIIVSSLGVCKHTVARKPVIFPQNLCVRGLPQKSTKFAHSGK